MLNVLVAACAHPFFGPNNKQHPRVHVIVVSYAISWRDSWDTIKVFLKSYRISWYFVPLGFLYPPLKIHVYLLVSSCPIFCTPRIPVPTPKNSCTFACIFLSSLLQLSLYWANVFARKHWTHWYMICEVEWDNLTSYTEQLILSRDSLTVWPAPNDGQTHMLAHFDIMNRGHHQLASDVIVVSCLQYLKTSLYVMEMLRDASTVHYLACNRPTEWLLSLHSHYSLVKNVRASSLGMWSLLEWYNCTPTTWNDAIRCLGGEKCQKIDIRVCSSVRPLSNSSRIHEPTAKNSCTFGGHKIPRNTVLNNQFCNE